MIMLFQGDKNTSIRFIKGENMSFTYTNNDQNTLPLSSDTAGIKLVNAAARGDVRRLQQLIDQGVGVDSRGSYGQTALYEAAWNGNDKCLQMLIDHGDFIRVRRFHGFTLLHAAAFSGNCRSVQMVYDLGADIDAKDDKGRTAFELAVRNKEHETAKLLQSLKANNPTPLRRNGPVSVKDRDPDSTTSMKIYESPRNVTANPNPCSGCKCKEYSTRVNHLHNQIQVTTAEMAFLQTENTELKRKVSETEERVKDMESRERGFDGYLC